MNTPSPLSPQLEAFLAPYRPAHARIRCVLADGLTAGRGTGGP